MESETLKSKEEKKNIPNIIQEGRRVLNTEAQALLRTSQNLGKAFEDVVKCVLACPSKLIVTGMGKSGQVGKKIASTLSSTGTPALFLHPSESSHGDLGVISRKDVLLAISQSGKSHELNSILNFAVRRGLTIIAMTGSLKSPLAKVAHFCLDTSVEKEACPFNLAPTSSSTVTLALGDALAMAALQMRGFKKENYADFHPGGHLGKRLLIRIEKLMHSEKSFALVKPQEKIENVLKKMTSKAIRGIAGVVNQKGSLVGVITDGDLRRFFLRHGQLRGRKASEVMSNHPKTLAKGSSPEKALFLMETFKIQSLFVVKKQAFESPKNPSSQDLIPIGLVHFQDFLQAGMTF